MAQGFADGTGNRAMFSQPMGIALEANGNLLVADSWNMRIREVTPAGVTTTYAGNGSNGIVDGPGTAASLSYPMTIALLPGGDALIAEASTGVLRRIAGASGHAVGPFAGDVAVYGWDDGPLSDATVSETVSIGVRPSDGLIALCDAASARIRAIANSQVTTLAGGLKGGTIDGAGRSAGFGAPRGIAFAPDGSAYVADAKERTVRKLTGF